MASEAMISQRVRAVPGPSVDLRRKPPADFIVFGGGLPDPVTHPVADLGALMAEILAANDQAVMGYGFSTAGDVMLREFIAARAGAGMGADNIVLTNGSSGAIGLAALTLLEPGDVVVCEAVTYVGALKAFMQMGAEIEIAPMDAGGLDPEGLAEALERVRAQGRRVKLIYTIPTNQNPTGATLSLERRLQVLRLAEGAGALVLQDDTYGGIRFTAAPPPLIALAPDRAIHLGSFSKTIAPALRVGWAAASPEIAGAMARSRVDLGVSHINQRVVARFIDDGRFDRHVAAATALYARKRDLMLRALERHCGKLAQWNTPEGGFFLWLKLTGADAEAVLTAGEHEKVAFLPGPFFSARTPFRNHLRLSYGQVAEGDIEDGIARLARALAAAAQG